MERLSSYKNPTESEYIYVVRKSQDNSTTDEYLLYLKHRCIKWFGVYKQDNKMMGYSSGSEVNPEGVNKNFHIYTITKLEATKLCIEWGISLE